MFKKIYTKALRTNNQRTKILTCLAVFLFFSLIMAFVCMYIDNDINFKNYEALITKFFYLILGMLSVCYILFFYIAHILILKILNFLFFKFKFIPPELNLLICKALNFIKKCYFPHIFMLIAIPINMNTMYSFIEINEIYESYMYPDFCQDPKAYDNFYSILIMSNIINLAISTVLTIIFTIFNAIFHKRVFIVSKFLLENKWYNKYYNFSWFLVFLPWLIFALFYVLGY